MLDNLQLAAITNDRNTPALLRIPLHQDLQNTLATMWGQQYGLFMASIEEIEFDPGYSPQDNERFRLSDFELPECLRDESSQTISLLESISDHEDALHSVKGIAAFALINKSEHILFQNFTRSRVIHPGRFLFLQKGTYSSGDRLGLTLDSKLSALYSTATHTLLFHNFRATNTFLPLAQFYREASANDIRTILSHELFAPEDTEAIAMHSSQWFRKRFALLRDSGIVDEYTAEEILEESYNYDVDIKLKGNKIIFPADPHAAKRLLQYLNEELFRGPITETLYETNSKKKAD